MNELLYKIAVRSGKVPSRSQRGLFDQAVKHMKDHCDDHHVPSTGTIDPSQPLPSDALAAIDAINQKLSTTITTVNANTSSINEVTTAVDTLEDTVADNTTKITDLDRDLKSLSSTVSFNKSVLDESIVKVNANKTAIDNLTSKLNEHIAAAPVMPDLSPLETRVETLETTVGNHTSQITENANDIDTLMDLVTDLDGKITPVTSEVATLKQQVADLDLDAVTQKITANTTLIQGVQSYVNNEISTLTSSVESAVAKSDTNTTKITLLEQQIKDITPESLDIDGKINTKLTPIIAEITSTKSQLASTEAKAEDNRSAIAGIDIRIGSINTQLNNLNTLKADMTKVNENAEFIKTNASNIETLTETVKGIQSIKADLDEVRANKESIQTNLDNITKNREDIDAFDTRLNELSGRVTSTVDRCSQLDNALAVTSTKVAANESQIANLVTKSNAVDTAISELTGNINNLSANYIDLQSQVNTNTTNITSITSRLTALATNLDGKANQVDLDTTNTLLTAVSTKANNNEAEIEKLKNSIVSIGSSVSTLAGNIDTVINEVNNNIAILENTVNDNSTEVNALKSEANSRDIYLQQQVDALRAKIQAVEEEFTDVVDITPSHPTTATVKNMIKRDIASSNGDLNMVLYRLALLEDQMLAMKKSNTTVVDLATVEGSSIEYPDTDIIISGSFGNKALTTTAKSVDVKNTKVVSGIFRVVTDRDLTIRDSITSGRVEQQASNAAVQLVSNEYVKITNTEFNHAGYNALEIGLDSNKTPKGVIIDNVDFNGEYSHNGISIFGIQENGNVTISNCNFKHTDNPIRISNKLNTKFTVNLLNCNFIGNDTGEYCGCVFFQDYTSPKEAQVIMRQFAPEKITLNIVNCSFNSKYLTMPIDLADIVGTKDINQILYVYYSSIGVLGYREYLSHYPAIHIS